MVRFLLPPDRGAVRGSARAAVLQDWMCDWLDTRVEVQLAKSYRELVEAISAGDVELAWTPPAVCAAVRERVRALYSVVRYAAIDCRASLVVRADATHRTLTDLAGGRASWVDPLSMNGHLMALAHLRMRGLDPATFFARQRFAGSYRNALADVAEGRADVTSVFVVDDDEQMTLRELHDLIGPEAGTLRLLEVTAPAPFDAIVIGPATPNPERIEKRLLALDNRKGPPAMLLEVCRADRFVRTDPQRYSHFDDLVDLSRA